MSKFWQLVIVYFKKINLLQITYFYFPAEIFQMLSQLNYLQLVLPYPEIFHSQLRYRTHAIITRGLYIFYPIFHCGLYCRAVSVTDNLCTKQVNSSIFGSKIRGS